MDGVDARGTLYVVATPLGNLEDLAPRAVRVLGSVSVIYAEDTRRSRILVDHFGISVPLRSLHAHNERERLIEVLKELDQGADVALLTDAGTPAVSDPGAVVVAYALDHGHRVCPIPGPSALVTALSACGFEAGVHGVLFAGFLPARGSERRAALARVAAHEGVVVLFESPHRLQQTLQDFRDIDSSRLVCVARELTKLHEQIIRGSLAEHEIWEKLEVRGEITLVLGPTEGQEKETPETETIDEMLARCIEAGLSARDSATAVAAISGAKRRDVYKRCQLHKGIDIE